MITSEHWLEATLAQGFGLLRFAARSSQQRIHDLAREVTESRSTPAQVVAELDRQERRV